MSEGKFPWKTMLFVSLAFNLLIVGAVIGVAVSGARLQRAAGPAGMGPAPGAFMGALPRQKARDIRERLAQTWLETEAERAAVRDARIALMRAIDQEKFDEVAVRAALARVRAADSALQARNQDAVIAVLKDLNPQERRAAIGAILREQGGARGPGLRQGPFGQGGMRDGLMGQGPTRQGPTRQGPTRQGPIGDGPMGDGPMGPGGGAPLYGPRAPDEAPPSP